MPYQIARVTGHPVEWYLCGKRGDEAISVAPAPWQNCDDLTKKSCEDIIEIFQSSNEDVILALAASIKAAKRCINKDKEFEELNETVHDIVRQLKELIVPERQADNSNGGSGKKIPAVDVQLILSSYRASRLSKKYNGRL